MMAKKKEMNRTSGTARRLTGRSEGIATKLKYGAPLTGSASGVKSISLKDAGEVLTQGIFSASRKGLKVDPAGLAMALPVGKVFKAGQALKAAGEFGVANQLLGRVAAKKAGQAFGKEYAISQRAAALDEATRTFNKGNRKSGLITKGETSRMTSEGSSAHPGGGGGLSVFPRLPKGNLPPGEKRTFDVLADPFKEGNWRSAAGIQPVKNQLKTKFNEFSKRVPSKSGISEVKQSAAKRGMKVTDAGAAKIDRLLKGRGR
jgi:hypothetical protein